MLHRRLALAAVIAAALLWLVACGNRAPDGDAGQTVSRAAELAKAIEGKPLRYLIGKDDPGDGDDDAVTEVSYSVDARPRRGIAIKYGNLFDETNSGTYGPYLHSSDTAAQYNEGQIDPCCDGWRRNIADQIARAKASGFELIEWDNPDAYSVGDVVGAVDEAEKSGIGVVAKNPLLIEDDALPYVAHRNVVAVIVEKGAGSPQKMDALRKRAGRPSLQIWFVFFGQNGLRSAREASAQITANDYRNMGVTHSTAGEYGNAVDVLRPR